MVELGGKPECAAMHRGLAEGLAHAFKSDQTPPFEQMVSGLFGQSNPDQKAGLLNQLLAALGPGGVAQVLGAEHRARIAVEEPECLLRACGAQDLVAGDDRYAVGAILRATPSTQTVYCDNRNYGVHHTKLTPVFFSEALGRFVTIPE